MNIRSAEYKDCERLFQISKNDLGYNECSLEIVQSQFKFIDLSRECVFVAEVDGLIVGFIHIEKYNVFYMNPFSNVLGLAVDADYRRQKIGQALLQRAEEWSKENGAVGIRLNSSEDRTEAHTFYRTQGYNIEKNQKCFIKMFSDK